EPAERLTVRRSGLGDDLVDHDRASRGKLGSLARGEGVDRDLLLDGLALELVLDDVMLFRRHGMILTVRAPPVQREDAALRTAWGEVAAEMRRQVFSFVLAFAAFGAALAASGAANAAPPTPYLAGDQPLFFDDIGSACPGFAPFFPEVGEYLEFSS